MTPDVSRVEYDAALKRVREASCCNVELLKECPRCERVTLAALGLDEPPTEPQPFDVRDHPMAFPSHVDEPPTEATRMSTEDALVYLVDRHHRTLTGSRKHDPENRDWTDCHCKTCELVRHVLPTARVLAEREQLAADRAALVAAAPPSESPKACPTCKGKGFYFDSDGHGGQSWKRPCPCRSGIDGGTANAD